MFSLDKKQSFPYDARTFFTPVFMVDKIKSITGTNPWFGVSMILVGIIIGYGFAHTTANVPLGGTAIDPTVVDDPAPEPTPTAEERFPEVENVVAVTDDDNRFGDANATVSIIEYSDFECPFCTRNHATMKELMETEDDINWVYRHFPLGFHANAQKAAEASECAADQGKFWEYSDLLFDEGAEIANLAVHAETVGLNVATFQNCLDSEQYAQKAKDQMAEGSNSGVRGTPGNIIYNNKTGKAVMVSGAQPLASFQEAIKLVR